MAARRAARRPTAIARIPCAAHRMSELPHSFADPGLLELALTHASIGDQPNNERLEFLGDAVLDLIVADEL